MRRHRDRYSPYRDESGGHGRHGPPRGRYAREDGAGRAEGVHWEPDSHLPGNDPAESYAPSAGGPGGRGGYGRQQYGRGFRDFPHESDGEHRGHGPRGYQRSDARILEQVCEHLTDDPMVDARGIEVRCQDGEVVLEGEVPGRWMKHRAEDIAAAVAGDDAVENRIRMARRGGAARSDDEARSERGVPPQQPH